MLFSSSTLMLVAAMSVREAMAGPAHAHHHRHARDKRATDWSALDWKALKVDWNAAYSKGLASTDTVVAPVATPTSAAPVVVAPTTSAVATAATSAAASSQASSSSSDSAGLWRNLVGFSNGRTSFGAQTAPTGSEVTRVGNVGGPYGSNIILADSSGSYTYTINVKNGADSEMTIVFWNKPGADLKPNSGATTATVSPSLTFTLGVGESKLVAVDEDSNIAWAQATDQITSYGAFATTWGEASFASTGSGYDVSAILQPAGTTYSMAITADGVSCQSVVSPTVKISMWISETETAPAANGQDTNGSCFVSGSSAHLTVVMSGTS